MSRVQRKKNERKSKIYFKIYIIIMIALLISGLIAVDYEIREMLAIDEVALLGYSQLENDKYIIYIIGGTHLVDTKILRSEIDNRFAEFKEIAYNIKEDLVNILNQIVLQ